MRSDAAFAELAKVFAFVFLAFWIVLLPKLGLWHKLPMAVRLNGSERLLVPAPPLTRYLTTEDLELFARYKEKRFIADPWKGLVIGAATYNYPLDSKSSTLTNKILQYDTFMGASCDQKLTLIKKYRVDLVYSTKIDCPKGFAEQGKSSEGFFLYDVSVISEAKR